MNYIRNDETVRAEICIKSVLTFCESFDIINIPKVCNSELWSILTHAIYAFQYLDIVSLYKQGLEDNTHKLYGIK